MDTNPLSIEPQPARSTILGSFLRGRPRNSSQSGPVPAPAPTPEFPSALRQLPRENSSSPQPSPPASRRLPTTGNSTNTSPSPDPVAPSQTIPGAGLAFSMLRRRRSAGVVAQPTPAAPVTRPSAPSPNSNNPFVNQAHVAAPPALPGTYRIRLVPHLESRRSLKFDAITRDLSPSSPALRIGRFTDRSGLGVSAVNALGTNKLAFKSKVVSRAHAEIWVENSGSSVKFFIKDTKSSSGTFLNHVRLAPAATESRPYHVRDGDILQLGVDYQGGSEDIYKSVKIRIELGREWQSGANKFNTNAFKNLKSLAQAVSGGPATSNGKGAGAPKGVLPDCCICLFTITIRQALFIAPCSHTFHYKCIRPLIESHYPGFSCPLCRTFADLEEDVEVEAEIEEFEEADFDAMEKEGDADRDLPTPIGDGEDEGDGATGPSAPTGAGGSAEDDDNENDSAVEEVAAFTLRQQHQNRLIRERDRDVGAETDVEPAQDAHSTAAGPSGSGRPRRNGHGRNLSAQMDPMELIRDQDEFEAEVEADDDVDMVDVAEHNADSMGVDEDFDDDVDYLDPEAEAEGRSGSEEAGPANAKRKR